MGVLTRYESPHRTVRLGDVPDMDGLTEKQWQELWGEDSPYSQVQLIMHRFVMDELGIGHDEKKAAEVVHIHEYSRKVH